MWASQGLNRVFSQSWDEAEIIPFFQGFVDGLDGASRARFAQSFTVQVFAAETGVGCTRLLRGTAARRCWNSPARSPRAATPARTPPLYHTARLQHRTARWRWPPGRRHYHPANTPWLEQGARWDSSRCWQPRALTNARALQAALPRSTTLAPLCCKGLNWLRLET